MGTSASTAKVAVTNDSGSNEAAQPKAAVSRSSAQHIDPPQIQQRPTLSQPTAPPIQRQHPAPTEKPVSAERLKRLALGQKGYKDEVREYDPTAALRSSLDSKQNVVIRGNLVVGAGTGSGVASMNSSGAVNAPRGASRQGIEEDYKAFATQTPQFRPQQPQQPPQPIRGGQQNQPQRADATRARGWSGTGQPPQPQRPPPPRRPGMPTGNSTPAQSTGSHVVYAPSEAPLPVAALQGPPPIIMQSQGEIRTSLLSPTGAATPVASTSSNGAYYAATSSAALPFRSSGTEINNSVSTSSKVQLAGTSVDQDDDDDDDDDIEDSGELYDWTEMNTTDGQFLAAAQVNAAAAVSVSVVPKKAADDVSSRRPSDGSNVSHDNHHRKSSKGGGSAAETVRTTAPTPVQQTTLQSPGHVPTQSQSRGSTNRGAMATSTAQLQPQLHPPASRAGAVGFGPPSSQPPGLPAGLARSRPVTESAYSTDDPDEIMCANFSEETPGVGGGGGADYKQPPAIVPALPLSPSHGMQSPKGGIVPGRGYGGVVDFIMAGPGGPGASRAGSPPRGPLGPGPGPGPAMLALQPSNSGKHAPGVSMGTTLGLQINTSFDQQPTTMIQPSPGGAAASAAATNNNSRKFVGMGTTGGGGGAYGVIGGGQGMMMMPPAGMLTVSGPLGPGGGARAVGSGGGPGTMTISGPTSANPTGRNPINRNTAAGKPPTPNSTNQFSVKETNEVKRNKAQIPSSIKHNKPTTGDWLKKRYIVNNYILLDTLGTGSYGEVRLCKDRTTDHLFAIKIISKDMLKKRKGGNTKETYFEDIKREIAIMKKLQHPNVLRLYEVLDDPNVNKMYLVLEYMKRGDLINILKGRQGKESTSISDLELWNIFRQVVAGIRYLHMQNIVHGDIKPQNLLISEDGIVKIADFGISKMLSTSGQTLSNAAGTPAFMSPELCAAEGSFSGQLADVWALGATMFMLKFGHPPFVASNIMLLYNKIRSDPLVFPYQIDPGLQDLLENMMIKDASKRYTLVKVGTHPWLRIPPAVAADLSVNANSSLSSMPGAGGGGGHGSSQQETMFKPPPNYDKEEQDAMQGGLKTIEDTDIFMSIGNTDITAGGAGRRGLKKGKQKSTAALTKDQQAGRSTSDEALIAAAADAAGGVGNEDEGSSNSGGGDNIMSSNWGADVFDIVDDDGVDDESSDEDEEEDAHDFSRTNGAAEAKAGAGGVAPLDVLKEIIGGEVSVDSSDLDDDDEDDEVELKAAGGGGGGRFVSKSSASTMNSGSRATAMSSSSSGGPRSGGDTIGNIPSVVQVSTDDSDSFVDDDTISKGSSMHTGLRFSFDGTAVEGYNPDTAGGSAMSSSSGSGSQMNTHPLRSEMSSDEQELRAKKFKSKMTKRSIEQMVKKQEADPPQESPSPSPSKGGRRSSKSGAATGAGATSFASPPASPGAIVGMLGPKKTRISQFDGASSSSRRSGTGAGGAGGGGGGGGGGSLLSSRLTTPENARRYSHLLQDDDEDTVELSMEQFGEIMDTLALQAQPLYEEASSPVNVSIEPSQLNAELRNYVNGTGAGFHQERGNRDYQEDRCLLITDLSAVYTTGQVVDRRGHRVSGRDRREFFASEVDPNKVDLFKKFSIACLFDGHSGSRCSEFLYQNFAQTLTAHPKILDKTPETALLDVFQTLDRMVCDKLIEEGDTSGSTGLVIVYDGRRHILSIANIGDSMCVLSRGGRAVVIHQTHRLKDNAAECKRIEAAGGAVKNYRVHGMLAVSRAFGDIELKDIRKDAILGPVISTPEVVSEVVTPLTEFCILATDGLWDRIGPQAAVNFVRKKLSQKENVQECARALVNEALSKGSQDNVTVLIMAFHMSPPVIVATSSSAISSSSISIAPSVANSPEMLR